MIAGRSKEKALLSQILNSHQAEFIAIYGRRRIGKTFLVESFFEGKTCLFFHMVGIQKGLMKEHLSECAKEIGRVFYGGVKLEVAKNWMQAFEALNNAIQYQKFHQPIVLFFDEFPWLATPRSRLLTALEYYWNRFWKNDSRIKLIVCGSSASWIIKKIIHNKGGLHNRITQQIHLKPFNLLETKLFLESKHIKLNDKQVLDLYFVMGGVPFYLNQIHKGLSIAENVNELCFKKEGPLFDEYNKLFRSLFDEADAYEELIRMIAQNRHGISRSDIEKSTRHSTKGGTLSDRLKDLEMAGFIKGFLPIGHAMKGTFYRIIDEYVLFYLQWIAPEKNNIELDMNEHHFWLERINSPQYPSWRGYAFESVCYKHIIHIKSALGIKASSKIGAWRFMPRMGDEDQGAQIDLLFDRKDDAITLCEIKYTDEPFILTKEYVNLLKRKIDVFKEKTRTKKQLFLVFISSNGVKQNYYAEEFIAKIVTLEQFFLEK